MKNTVALIGNPNSGKTSLFNVITGLNAKTGNFAGVTVESKVGYYKKDKNKVVVDLPGLYDLTAKSKDESVVLEYLKGNKVSAIVNVVDGLNLERNLYLTLKLASLNIPMVIAVNFYDQIKKRKINLDVKKLEKVFNVKVVCVSALKKINIDKLMKEAFEWKKPPVNLLLEYKSVSKAYDFIQSLSNEVLNGASIKENKLQIFLDKLFFNKFSALPIFILFLSLAFYLTNIIGTFFERGVNSLYLFLFGDIRRNGVIIDLIMNGVVNGLFTVLSFLPHVLTLFFFLSIMEDSGYTSRVAFMLDGLLRPFGISGKSVISFLLCSGCTVNGVLSTRIIEDEEERTKCVSLCPFIPCGAKSAVFLYFVNKFFSGNPLISVSLYFFGVLAVVIFSKIFTKNKVSFCRFIMEIPPLRVPTFKKILAVTTEKLKDFFLRVAPVIMVSSILMSILMRFGITGYVGDQVEKSFLYLLGSVLKYIFVPLGFGNWQASVALLTGTFAKEGIIGALEIVGVENLFYSPFSAYGFLCFVTFSPPCVASVMAIKKELNNAKTFIFVVLFQVAIGYLSAMLINFVGVVFIYEKRLLFVLLICIILLSLVMNLVLKNIKSRGRENENDV